MHPSTREFAHQSRLANHAREEPRDLEVVAVLVVEHLCVALQQGRVAGDECFVQYLRSHARSFVGVVDSFTVEWIYAA